MKEIVSRKYTHFEQYLEDIYSLTNKLAKYYLKFASETDSKNKAAIRAEASELFKDKIKITEGNLSSSKIFIAIKEIKTKYKLSTLGLLAVILAVMYGSSEKFKSTVLSLSSQGLTYEIALSLYDFITNSSEKGKSDKQLCELKAELKPLRFSDDNLEIDSLLLDIITKNSDKDIEIKGVKIYPVQKVGNKSPLLPVREEKAEEIKNFISNNAEHTLYFELHGQEGIGKKTIVKRVAELLGKELITVNFKKFIQKSKESWYENFVKLIYENDDCGAVLCLDNFDLFFDEEFKLGEEYAEKIINASGNHFKTVFVLLNSDADMSEYRQGLYWFDIALEELSETENLKLWQVYMADIKSITDITPEEMANKFSFTPAQIKGAIIKAQKDNLWKNGKKLGKEDMCRCAYSQVISTLGEKAKLINKKYTWNDIIIDSDTKLSLQRACERIKYKHIVYNQWGMESRALYGKGLSMMFYGVSGTGKTMAAQVIASELGLELYKVDIARVVSKYIGETEKNLKDIFDEAKKSSAILLFDEADSLFSKRTDVKDSHDRNANIETAFLLQQMEDYDGITILTTNKDANIDDAFKRRITFKISFSNINPGIKGSEKYEERLGFRKELWVKFFKNGKMPLDNDIDFDYLAESFIISGAEIRNVALTAAFLAAAQNDKKVGFKHILYAMKNVLGIKNNEFGPQYSYLLKDN